MTTPHSIAEFTDPEVSPENNRKGTVSYASRFEDRQPIPAIIMKGQWLEAAGFATGTKIDIKVMDLGDRTLSEFTVTVPESGEAGE